MLPYLNSRDIADWKAYERIEPFGGDHAEQLHGILCETLAAAHGATVNREVFMPSYRKDTAEEEKTEEFPGVEVMSAEEIHDNMAVWLGDRGKK